MWPHIIWFCFIYLSDDRKRRHKVFHLHLHSFTKICWTKITCNIFQKGKKQKRNWFNLWHSCYPALPKCSSVTLPPCGHVSQHQESPTSSVCKQKYHATHIGSDHGTPLFPPIHLHVTASQALITNNTNLKVAIHGLTAAQLLGSPSTFTFISQQVTFHQIFC